MKYLKEMDGFTLIELMVVVAIVSILIAVAIPQFANYRQKAYNTTAINDVRNLTTSLALTTS